MKRICFLLVFFIVRFASGQNSGWGDARIALYAQGISSQDRDASSSYSELVTQFSLSSPYDSTSWQYGLDLRTAAYPGAESRDSRVSVYNAFIGQQYGRFGVKAGQIWLNELGSLGSIGGGVLQYKIQQPKNRQFRLGVFGGLEPEILDASYVSGVRKFGGFAALDAEQGRSHVLGFVTIRNEGLTERSVFVFTNYVPIRNSFFLYQSAELDVTGPAGNGSGGLNYFFINGRYSPSSLWNLFATYHHGRSIDSRSITEDQINGRPVDPNALKGLLFESLDLRATVRVAESFHVFGSYGRDRNNREENSNQRLTYGFFSGAIGNSGVDVYFSGNRVYPPEGPAYDYWSVSIGKTLAERVYISGNYASSVSLVSVSDENGITIKTGPRANIIGASGLVNVTRSLALLVTVERSSDKDFSENRVLGGITFRMSGKRKKN